MPREPTVVYSKGIDRIARVATVLHHTLGEKFGEELWLMIPVDADTVVILEEIVLVTSKGEQYIDLTDRLP